MSANAVLVNYLVNFRGHTLTYLNLQSITNPNKRINLNMPRVLTLTLLF